MDSLGGWSDAGAMATARSAHAATLLADGNVLVLGGYATSPHRQPGGDSAEIYEVGVGRWVCSDPVQAGDSPHHALPLPDGSVLSPSTVTSRLYHRASRTWSLTGALRELRADYTATVMADGRVLVAGGYGEMSGSPMVSAEVYEPRLGAWVATSCMQVGRLGHTAVLLDGGRVLVSGGLTVDHGSVETSAASEIYDPDQGTWELVEPMVRARHSHTATALQDGSVLVAGGGRLDGSVGDCQACELFNPGSGQWSVTEPLLESRSEHTATLLGDGRVLVVGGTGPDGLVIGSAEVFDPSVSRWFPAASLSTARRFHSATLLRCGEVLVAGGDCGDDEAPNRYIDSAERWTPPAQR